MIVAQWLHATSLHCRTSLTTGPIDITYILSHLHPTVIILSLAAQNLQLET